MVVVEEYILKEINKLRCGGACIGVGNGIAAVLARIERVSVVKSGEQCHCKGMW